MKKKYILIFAWVFNITIMHGQPKVASPKKGNKQSSISTVKPVQSSTPLLLKHPDWSLNNTIYEVNLRQYAKESSFKNFEKEIPRLKLMGIGILWFMPIHPIGEKGRKGSLGSYYAVKNYLEVSSEYGTMEEFNHMVKVIHESGMKVIIDWVANHTSPDNVWVKENPDFFTKDKNGNFVPPVADWSDVIDLNYDNKKMRIAMIDAMKFWITKGGIDGFRCDVAEMVPTDFWIQCRNELDKIKPVFMLAEGEKQELHKAFDMTYTWSFYHAMKDVVKGTKKRSDLLAYFDEQKKNYNANDIRMYFTSNHDENTWNATEFEAFGDAHKAVAAISTTLPGMPLIYSGQESAQTKHLKFFDKDVIDWNNYSYQSFYSSLMKLHLTSRAVAKGSFEILDLNNENVFSYKRAGFGEEVLIIMNLTNNVEVLKIKSNLNGTFSNYLNDSMLELNSKTDLTLEPYQFFILRRNVK